MSRLVKNSLLYFISTISIKAASFILLPFYTYLITPEEYGHIYVINALVTFTSLLLSFSLGSAIQRFYFDCKSIIEIKKMYSTIVSIVFMISIPVTSLLLFYFEDISYLLNIPSYYLLIGIVTSFFSVFFPLILALLYALQEGKKISITITILGIIQIIIQLMLVLNMNNKAFALLTSLLINSIISFVIFVVYSFPFIIRVFDFNRSLTYLKYSLHQLPSDISVWFISFSDRILLNKMKGSHDTGIYGIGSTLGQIPQILFHSVNKAYVPYVFENYKKQEVEPDQDGYGNIVKSTTILFTIITVVATIMIVFSNNLISVFSPIYAESGSIMALILFAFLIDAYRVIFMNPISYNIKYVKIKSAIWIFSAISSISLNLILIPKFSIYGACMSLLISYIATFFLILYFSNKAIKIKYETKKMLTVFLVSLVFMLQFLIGYSSVALLIKIVLSIVYLIIISKLLDLNIKQIKGIIKRDK